jgi:hypothetical protein
MLYIFVLKIVNNLIIQIVPLWNKIKRNNFGSKYVNIIARANVDVNGGEVRGGDKR